MIEVGASILSADFGHLADEVKRLEQAGVDALHIDVMDGHFVPNLTLGPKIVAAINRSTNLFLDVHLMMYNPFDYIETFVASGADRITFHFEATEHVEDTLLFIKKCGIKAGLAFNPETSFDLIPKYLPMCDLVLLMSVHPGFGGQEFLEEVVDKIRWTADVAKKQKMQLSIQVDGGINPNTGKVAVKAGANFLVSGNYLFTEESLEKAVKELKACGKP